MNVAVSFVEFWKTKWKIKSVPIKVWQKKSIQELMVFLFDSCQYSEMFSCVAKKKSQIRQWQ